MIKKIIIAVLILAGLVGAFFGIRYELRLYKAVIAAHQRINVLENFLVVAFPQQTNAYLAAREAELKANEAKK